jgi:benzylsuccinate CoA-transferase BbsF subunit
MPGQLLEGVKVADFSRVIVGPLTTKTLCDWGATVVKIEGRSRPGHYRTTGPEPDLSAHFTSWNTGKLSIALNLATAGGIALAKEIVAWSDIVVESFAGGSMQRMGLGYEELKKVRPDVIMLSSCMQGQTGPFSSHPGWGFQLSALSGFCHITGWPDRPPPELGVYTDFVAPHFNVSIILAALLYRRRTGQGLYIDMSQFENAIHFMAPALLDCSVNSRTAGRVGNRSSFAAPHGAYSCKGEDRWCAIAVLNDEQWRSLCRVMDRPEALTDPRFSTLLERKRNEDELDLWVNAWTSTRTAEDVMRTLQESGVPAGILETGEDLLEKDAQIKFRGTFREVDHPRMGMHHPPASPFLMSSARDEIRRAPLLGEHNEYVLRHILGKSDGEIADLVINGAVE